MTALATYLPTEVYSLIARWLRLGPRETAVAATPSSAPASARRPTRVLARVPLTPDVARHLGALAARHEVVEELATRIPQDLRASYDEGVDAHGRQLRVPPPTGVDQAALRRLDRLVLRASGGGNSTPIEITRLVRRTAGPQCGATFELTLLARGRSVVICRLAGRELLSPGAIASRAAEEGLVLPAAKAEEWRDIVAAAMETAVVELPAPAEAITDAIEAEIVRYLRESPRVPAVADLAEQGVVYIDEEQVIVRGQDVVRAVCAALTDDGVDRDQVVSTARRLGLLEVRPRLVDGSHPRMWRLPRHVLHEHGPGPAADPDVDLSGPGVAP